MAVVLSQLESLVEMTWVVATNVSLLGYAVAISDIRVTFGHSDNRRERDCLQKIYSVGPHMAAGFAGSVQIGFEMIRSLQKGLVVDDPSLSWDPTIVAEEWPETARTIFRKYPGATQKHGAQMVLLGAHPTEDVGRPGVGRTYVYSFSWPEFEPVQAKPHEVLSIGSGSGVAPYRKLLERYSGDHEFRTLLMHGESVPGGTATMLAINVTSVLKRHPTEGISQHLHVCLVTRGAVQIWPNDHSHQGRWEAYSLGSPANNPRPNFSDMNNFIMPSVATSFDELCQMLNANAVLGGTLTASGCVSW